MAYDPKKASQASKVEADEAWLQRYDTDRRSIYIGDLPTNVENMESSVRDIVDNIGDVVEVQVVRKATQVGMNSYSPSIRVWPLT
jgi:polyadenylate-binding protein